MANGVKMPTLAAAGANAAGLRVLSIVMGVFLLFMGINKLGWLTDAGVLASRFAEWLETAGPASRWYLQTLAIPGAPVFARVVPLAEIAAGAALVCGYFVRGAAALAFLMVLNFHFASDVLFHYSYLTNGYGLPVLGSLMALAIGGSRLPFTISR
jgi:uncharacterized membrane protein YphA (DoxX/SURF4 family)